MKKYILFKPTFLSGYYYPNGEVEISPEHIEYSRVVTVPVFVGTEAVECLDLVPKPKPFWKFWEKTEYEYKYTGQTRYTNKTEMRKLLQIHMVSGDVLTVAEYEGE